MNERQKGNKYEEENEDLKEIELKELITKVKLVLEEIEYEIFRQIVVNEHTRADGRAMDEIRPLSTDIDIYQEHMDRHYLRVDKHKVYQQLH